MSGFFSRIAGEVKLKCMELEHEIAAAKYDLDEEIEFTEEDEEELRNLQLRVNGKWDYVNDCPKGEGNDEL